MTSPPRPLQQILAERAALVGEVARLNSEQLRHSQLAGGLEIEVLGCRRAVEAGGGGEPARRSLEEAQAREARARSERAGCEEALDALALRMAELDRELAAAS